MCRFVFVLIGVVSVLTSSTPVKATIILVPTDQLTIQLGIDSASGMYFYRITAEGFTKSKKMVLLK